MGLGDQFGELQTILQEVAVREIWICIETKDNETPKRKRDEKRNANEFGLTSSLQQVGRQKEYRNIVEHP
jgi:hypothetical protein